MTRSIIGIQQEVHFLFVDIKRLTQGNFFYFSQSFFFSLHFGQSSVIGSREFAIN